MPFCPNPECPYLKRIGKPAKYLEGVDRCSDCGSPLKKEGTTTIEKVQTKKKTRKPLSDFQRRLIYTFLLLALSRVLAHIPAPGIDTKALYEFLVQRGAFLVPFRMSVLALGIMPYISGYVIVELFSLFAKPLKNWRAGGYQGRLKLKRMALFVTLILALVQGYWVATGLESMSLGRFVYNPGLGFRVLFALTLAAATFILIWIADQISRKGIGNGVSVIIFAFTLSRFIPSLFSYLHKISEYRNYYSHSPFEYLFVAGLISAALIIIVLVMEKSHEKIRVKYSDETEAHIPLKTTTAGIVAAEWAASITMLPATVLGFIENYFLQHIARCLSPGGIGYFIFNALAIVFLYYLFTSAFYNPEKLNNFLKEKGAVFKIPEGKNAEQYMDRVLEIMASASAIYLCFFVFVPEILTKYFNLPIFLGGLEFIAIVAIGLDLTGELKIRKKSGNLVKIAEYHNVPEAGLCKSILEQKGIPCHLQGYYYRALFYFFGPYIEISVLVPEGMASEAGEIIKKYLNENVLVSSAPIKGESPETA